MNDERPSLESLRAAVEQACQPQNAWRIERGREAVSVMSKVARAGGSAELGREAAEGEPMSHQTPMLRRPVRTTAIVAGVVAFVGSGAALIPGIAPPTALAFALVYGIILGLYVVGVLLASEIPATRWWWVGSALPFTCMAVVAIGVARWPEAVMRWWRVIGGVYLSILVSWLLAGCLLAVLGWWSYARHRRAVTDA